MKKILTVVFLGFLLTVTVFAITADDYFEFATNKYLRGDIAGAAQDVAQALKINPTHAGALELKALIDEEKVMSGKAPTTTVTTSTVVTTTTRPVRVTVPAPVVRRRVEPARRAVKKEEEKEEEAHRLYIKGEAYFLAGNYEIARDYFTRVWELKPGHEGTKKYLEKIQAKLVKPPTVGTPKVVKKRGLKDILASIARRYDWRIFVLGTFLTLAGILVLYLLFRILCALWISWHIYCPECQTRNSKSTEFCRKCGSRLKVPELTEEQKDWFGKFGWKKNPFTLNIIPDVFAGHKVEISMIVEKLNTHSGHILVIGGLGTGKTTLLQWLEKNIKDKFEPIYVLRPPTRPAELIDLVSATIANKTTSTHKYSVYDFQELCKNYKRNILLLLDEAHEFNEEFEQFIRTLGDLPNIYLVMAGLPQAREKLKRDLPALFDRIVESVLLGSLTIDETKELILKRITNAGGKGLGPFTEAAIVKVYDMSYGIPRGILKICDWVITHAIRANKTYIDEQDILAYSDEVKTAKPQDENNDNKNNHIEETPQKDVE